jgi:hypothetical protein
MSKVKLLHDSMIVDELDSTKVAAGNKLAGVAQSEFSLPIRFW